jgi:hypothetical protein
MSLSRNETERPGSNWLFPLLFVPGLVGDWDCGVVDVVVVCGFSPSPTAALISFVDATLIALIQQHFMGRSRYWSYTSSEKVALLVAMINKTE